MYPTVRQISSGAGSIKGDSFGIYATWLPGNDFYLDVSYRAMSFDLRLNSAGGEVRGGGDASAINIEAGYGWDVGGLTVERQLQYTRTSLDSVDELSCVLVDFKSEGGALESVVGGQVGVRYTW